MISSIRLRNSGPEVLPQRFHHLPAHALSEIPGVFRNELAAGFDVMITTTFLKSTVRPLLSVSRPSSSSCSSTFSTSGCAFRSSNSTTE